MDLGWKFIIEFVTIYIIIIAVSVYALDRAGLEFGPAYAAALLGVNVIVAVLLFFLFDRGRLIRGAGREAEREARQRLLIARREARQQALARALGEGAAPQATEDDSSEGGG
jgi:hypothetical protein